MAKILIVDDDEDILFLISQYLKSVGIEHDLAASAKQARSLLVHSRYDFVVSDFSMPGQSGLDLLDHVSSMYPKTKFVLVTGCDDLRIKRESTRMGVHAYIQKPFYLTELLRILIDVVAPDGKTPATGTTEELSCGS